MEFYVPDARMVVWVVSIRKDDETFITAFTSKRKAVESCVDDIVTTHEEDGMPSIQIEGIVQVARKDLEVHELFMDQDQSGGCEYRIDCAEVY